MTGATARRDFATNRVKIDVANVLIQNAGYRADGRGLNIFAVAPANGRHAGFVILDINKNSGNYSFTWVHDHGAARGLDASQLNNVIYRLSTF